MDHYANWRRAPVSYDETPTIFDKCLKPIADTIVRIQCLGKTHRSMLVARFLGMALVLLFCLLPLGITGASIWLIDELTNVSQDTMFWFVSSIALAVASLAPLATVDGYVRAYSRAKYRRVLHQVNQRDPEIWKALDAKMETLKRELQSERTKHAE